MAAIWLLYLQMSHLYSQGTQSLLLPRPCLFFLGEPFPTDSAYYLMGQNCVLWSPLAGRHLEIEGEVTQNGVE